MVETAIKPKTIQYRRAVVPHGLLTLQEMLQLAFDHESAKTAQSRREPIATGSDIYRLINHHTKRNGIVFGQLVRFESGKAQQIITLDDKAEFYEIKGVTPGQIKDQDKLDDIEEQKREFIESILYFGCLDNHVVMVQSAALKSRDLETHLSWLLSVKTDVMEQDSMLLLQDKPSEEVLKKVINTPVKKVNIGSPLASEQIQDGVPDDNSVEFNDSVKSVKWIPSGVGANVLQAFLGDDWKNTMKLDDCLDESNIHVKLQVTYNRKTTKSGQKVLDSIASSLRNLDDDDFEVEFTKGGTLKGGDLRLSGKISVKMINGSVDETDLYHQMHTWLKGKINTGDVEADEVK